MSDQTGKKVQLSGYAKVDAIHRWPKRHFGIPVLVRVVAPPGIGDRAPIDLVAVLDVSCRALTPENRQSMLEEAMRVVIGKLDDKDRLAIIPVQTSTLAEQTGLEEMSSEGRDNALAKVKSLAVPGDNKLAKALANAAKILEERPEDQKGRVAFVILISDGDDASIIEGKKIGLNCSVHTFGFRDAHNVRAMHHIAKSYTGTYGILNDEHDRITEAFEASISKITSVVAVQTEVHIALSASESSKATLSAIESGRSKCQIADDRKRGKIMVGTLQAGAVRNFIVYVDNVGEDEHDDLPRQLTVRFMYHHALSRVQERVGGQVVVVRHGVDRSKEVAAEIVRVEAVNIVGDILRKCDDKGRALVDAADELWEQWLRLKDSEYGREAGEACLISGLAAEMREMEASMRRSSGLSYMLSWQTCHTLQHQTPKFSPPLPMSTRREELTVRALASYVVPREYTDSETIKRLSVSSFEGPSVVSADHNKVQLTAWAKVDAIHRWPKRHSGIPVLVRVVAPPGIGDRAPIDLVAVLDVSCAALTPENRQSMLEEAMKVVIGQLDDKDRLAIVPVQTSTLAEQTGLMEMSSEGRSNAFAKVKSLAVIGDNKLAKALANAAKILEERQEDQKGRVSFVILISDGDDASITEGETINLNCSVHTFGFRDAHNVRAMHHIAKSHTGTYGILNDEHDRITEAFEPSISKITSVVAVRTEVRIACSASESSKATLSAIESGRSKWHIEGDRKSGYIMAGALQAGAVRNFIVYVDKVGEDELDNLPGQLKVRFKYNPASSTGQQELVDGQVVVVRQGVDRSKEVAAEIVRIEAINIVGDILHKYDDKGKALVDAADELWEQWLLLKDSEYGREAGEACLISGLAAEMREMEASMRRSSGLSYMLSWQTCHTLQHQTPGSRWAEKGSQQAQTPAQLSLPPKGMAAGAHAKVVGYCLCFSFLPLFLLWFCLRFVRIEF